MISELSDYGSELLQGFQALADFGIQFLSELLGLLPAGGLATTWESIHGFPDFLALMCGYLSIALYHIVVLAKFALSDDGCCHITLPHNVEVIVEATGANFIFLKFLLPAMKK